MASDTSEEDGNGKKQTFMCGVCEGFYGKPWTTEQRKELFLRMERFGMNSYLYAPKDDYKHRLYWRDLYEETEAADLQDLIEDASARGIKFIYAISPGLDIAYSSEGDVRMLTDKLGQVRSLGCQSFAVLFDDIEPDLCPQDEKVFESVGDAQCSVTNKVFKDLGEPDVFLFCPTEYCNSRAVPSLKKSSYLNTLGEKLDPSIHILWTGTRVVPRLILVDDILELEEVIKRKPLIWENLFANDYDQTRLYLGPYDGRPPELVKHLAGVLTNPNCEFEMNFVAMHTLAQWSKNRVQHFPYLEDGEDVEMRAVDEVVEYHPRRALVCALEDWLAEFYKCTGSMKKSIMASDNSTLKRLPEKLEGALSADSSGDSKMDTEKDRNSASPSPPKDSELEEEESKSPKKGSSQEPKMRKRISDEIDPLDVGDLLMLSDLFSLPFDHGPQGVHLLKEAHWLITQVARVKDKDKVPRSELKPEAIEWYERAMHFHDCYRNLAMLSEKVINIPNRDILYEMYFYLSDMRSVVCLINSYIKWHGMGKPDKEPFRTGEQEPWLHRGGLHGEFRRLLPVEGSNDMFPHPNNLTVGNRVFTIRPYFPCDKDSIYEVCRKTWDNGFDSADMVTDHSQLLADEMVGGLLQECPEFCFILQDEASICGFAVATLDVKEYQQKIKESWLPQMRTKYPCDLSKETCGNLTFAEEVIQSFHRDPPEIPPEIYKDFPSFIHLSVLKNRVEGIATPSQLMDCISKVLKARGSKGVHTVLRASHVGTLAFYLQLGFTDITDSDDGLQEEILVLGKAL